MGLPQQPPPPIQQQQLPQQQQPTQYFNQQAKTEDIKSALSPESQKYLSTDSGVYKPSIAEQLLNLAYGPPATTSATNTIPLILTASSTGSLEATRISTTAPLQIYGSLPFQPGQTFVSPDLAYSPETQISYAPQQTGMFGVLQTLKNILLRMLEILRPMGITNFLQPTEPIDEYAE